MNHEVISWDCKYGIDGRKCNSEQHQNNGKCRREYKKPIKKIHNYIWSNDNVLASVMEKLKIMFHMYKINYGKLSNYM